MVGYWSKDCVGKTVHKGAVGILDELVIIGIIDYPGFRHSRSVLLRLDYSP